MKRFIEKHPEALDLMAYREVVKWVEHMEKDGYTLATKPSKPKRRMSPDPAQRGWDWYIIEARWFHYGPVAIFDADHLRRKREEEARIGAGQLSGDGGVQKYMEEHGHDGIEVYGEGRQGGADEGRGLPDGA